MKAIIFNLLAWIMLPIMDGFAKYLSTDLPVLQITWARYFFTVAFTFPVMFVFYPQNLVWTDKPKLQFIRGLILLTANICFFYAISVISLAKALTLAFIAPLIVTAFSPVFLGEKVGFRRWSAVIIGFIGSLVVIRPGFVELNFASLAALGTGIFYGFYLIITRKLSTSDNPLLTLLMTGMVGRADDQDRSKIQNRFDEYNNKTAPLISFYKNQNKFYEIDGVGEINDISSRIFETIDNNIK